MNSVLLSRFPAHTFSENALAVFKKRYYQGEESSPLDVFSRVSTALAEVERDYGASNEEVRDFQVLLYDIMAKGLALPAGRTLKNAGSESRLISNCIVLHIDDSMESIFGTLRDAALLQKAGSGLGFPFHLLRPAGFDTKESQGIASGPISFLQMYDHAFGVVKQQNRHGANMAVMRVDHPDILEFIECKSREGDIRNFNVSVALTDEFLLAAERKDTAIWKCEWNGKDYLPREIRRDAYSGITAVPVELTADQMLDKIAYQAWTNGEPGFIFIDTVNKTNPLPGLGPLEASNPCSEQMLHSGDACNLGSINLAPFAEYRPLDAKIEDWKGYVNWEALRVTTRVMVQALDNVIDLTNHTIDRVNSIFKKNRRVGLGIMGFSNMLYRLRIAYNSPIGREVASVVMEYIRNTSIAMSEELGHRKGFFPNLHLSIYQDRPRRNAALTNIAPTGTTSMALDTGSGLEPEFALAYYKKVMGGMQMRYVNRELLLALEEAGYKDDETLDAVVKIGSLQSLDVPRWIKEVFVTTMDISPEDHVLMQSSFQKHLCNASSKTVNVPNKASVEDIKKVILLAWKSGCKGCTVYRDGSRFEQVLNLNSSTVSTTSNSKLPSALPSSDNNRLSTSSSSGESTPMSGSTSSESVSMELEKPQEEKHESFDVSSSHELCGGCGSYTLIRVEGCFKCLSCDYSKCSI